jgi:hypothetical protein
MDAIRRRSRIATGVLGSLLVIVTVVGPFLLLAVVAADDVSEYGPPPLGPTLVEWNEAAAARPLLWYGGGVLVFGAIATALVVLLERCRPRPRRGPFH